MLGKFFSNQPAGDGLQVVHKLAGHEIRLHIQHQMGVIGFAAELIQFNRPFSAESLANGFEAIEYGGGQALLIPPRISEPSD